MGQDRDRTELHHRLSEHLPPGYYNGEGQNSKQGFLDSQYPQGAVAFYEMLAHWRESDNFEGLVVE
ncbi:MAG TPA: hypothetical protein VKS22_12355 [Candidatus Binataceae bacterium]|nr:hypothetical protein [Candidatus Binataceae bacterium]